MKPLRMLVLTFAVIWTMVAAAAAADWPSYRGGIAHRGATPDQLSMPLVVHWDYAAPAKPRKGWAGEDGKAFERSIIMERVKFDDALHVAIADGRVFFGSSVDHQVHCRRADTGETVWTFFTGGPVRLAPTVADGRVYFGSDDGFVYCLDAATGKPVWKLRAGPADEWMLARGEMISRWPIRTGVLVADGTAYFGAGLFPHEEVYIYAVNADDGQIEWRRDNISHADAGRNDLSPQGYLLATDDLLIVPSGRALPAAIDRTTGDLVHKRTHGKGSVGGVVGGTEALLADGQIYSWGAHHIFAMDQKSGDAGFGYFDGRQMAIAGDAAYMANGVKVSRLDRLAYAAWSRKRHALEAKIAAETRAARARSKSTPAACAYSRPPCSRARSATSCTSSRCPSTISPMERPWSPSSPDVAPSTGFLGDHDQAGLRRQSHRCPGQVPDRARPAPRQHLPPPRAGRLPAVEQH